MIPALLIAAGLTCIIETLIISIIFKKEKLQNLILNIVLINLITNLTLNILNIIIQSPNFVIGAEIIIPAIEAVMYQYCYPKIKISKWLTICYIANAVSFGIGLLLM